MESKTFFDTEQIGSLDFGILYFALKVKLAIILSIASVTIKIISVSYDFN